MSGTADTSARNGGARRPHGPSSAGMRSRIRKARPMFPVLLCSLLLAPLPRVPRPRRARRCPSCRQHLDQRQVRHRRGHAPPPFRSNPRAQPRVGAAIKAGEKPQIRWQVRNLDSKAPVRNVVVHFLIRRVDTATAGTRGGTQAGSLATACWGRSFPRAPPLRATTTPPSTSRERTWWRWSFWIRRANRRQYAAGPQGGAVAVARRVQRPCVKLYLRAKDRRAPPSAGGAAARFPTQGSNDRRSNTR
jgi:hypothetical protein